MGRHGPCLQRCVLKACRACGAHLVEHGSSWGYLRCAGAGTSSGPAPSGEVSDPLRPRHTVEGVTNRAKVEFAREQRGAATRAEMMLWEAVRRKRLGVRMRRQHPINDFVLDFYCAEARLAIEIDGPVHAEQKGYDRARDEQLAEWGIRTLRVPEDRVREDLPAVLEEIRGALGQSAHGDGGDGE